MFLSPSAYSRTDHSYHPIADMDRDGFLEMAYTTGKYESTLTNPQRWEYGRFLPFNRWRVLYADTIIFPPPQGLQPSYFKPGAMGDADRDGLSEILGICFIFTGTTYYSTLSTMEQQFPTGPPDTITWSHVSIMGTVYMNPYMPGSLDLDSLDDFVNFDCSIDEPVMLENRGNNSYVRTWVAPQRPTSSSLAFGDFDMDGRVEFVGGLVEGRVLVWETTGDNQYRCVFEDRPPHPGCGRDCFSGRDVNRNGKPEFFLSLARYRGGVPEAWSVYLYMWEAVGDNRYVRQGVDSAVVMRSIPLGRSMCGDIDGDGVEEVVWATAAAVTVYSANPAGELERVYSWYNDHAPDHAEPCVNIADVNRNGYNDIVIAAGYKVSVLEIEAIRLLLPNSGTLVPGDTCRISWQTFDPPRCDSVSLFLRRDSTYRLDTIAHGLAPADTPYLWVVPDIRAESAWVMAIAYGPGWQFDECDSAIRILGTPGVEESPRCIYQTRLEVWPNPAPGRVNIEYELARAGAVELSVLDAAGRRVAVLASGRREAGRCAVPFGGLGHNPCPAPGVYFVRLVADGQRIVRKVVIR